MLLVILGIVAAMAATFFSAAFVLVERRKAEVKRPVGFPPPPMFPILVLTSEPQGMEPHIVHYKDLDNFRETHPRMTFLVPRGSEQTLNDKLNRKSRSGKFRVRFLSSGRQEFEVSATWDEDRHNVGWYDADAQGIRPRHHQFFGPGLAMAACGPSLLISLGVGLVLTILAIVWAGRRPVNA